MPELISKKAQYFFNPWVDFLALGGGSVIVLLAMSVLIPKDAGFAVAAFSLWLAHFINHPHFAHSYQIFYRNFPQKLLMHDYAFSLRLGYWFAGIVVPVLLVAFLGANYVFGNSVVLGLALNLMAFLVGWHYVKQGYGILMADSVLKKNFFSGKEKNIFLVNAYACWLITWAYANQVVREHQLFNLHWYTFGAPEALIQILIAVLVATTICVAGVLCARLFLRKGFPFNGVVAYLVSLYLWVVFIHVNPFFVFMVPAFHSLQYLVVVWRYRINYAESQRISSGTLSFLPFGRFFKRYTHYQMTLFILSAALMGYFGFWGFPFFLGDVIAYDKLIWDSSVFIVICWVFINVHHYFIDSIIWRKNNKDVFQYLFEFEPR